MQIKIEPYNDDWVRQFLKIKNELLILLKDFNPKIEHFGSTSVPGLAAKPVIDILVGVQSVDDFKLLPKKILKSNKYIYYKVFNKIVPERRLFVRLKDEINTEEFVKIYHEPGDIPHNKINRSRIAHVHIWKYNSKGWIRHIAFREYLKSHNEVKLKYEILKKQLSQRDWKNGMEYNEGKDEFINTQEKKAILWYSKIKQK